MSKAIEERIESGIKHAEKIIEDFDNLKIKEKDAEDIFKESNKMLDECIDLISNDKFHIEEVQKKKNI